MSSLRIVERQPMVMIESEVVMREVVFVRVFQLLLHAVYFDVFGEVLNRPNPKTTVSSNSSAFQNAFRVVFSHNCSSFLQHKSCSLFFYAAAWLLVRQPVVI